MPKCFLCHRLENSVHNLFKHFTFAHENHSFRTYHCIEDGCGRSFHLKNTFRKHINTHVARNIISRSDRPLDRTHTESIHSETTDSFTHIEPTMHSESMERSRPSMSNTAMSNTAVTNKYSLAHFMSAQYANPLIPRNAVQSMANEMQKYIETLSGEIDATFTEMYNAFQQGSNISTFRDKFLSIAQSPNKDLDTEHKRFKYFETKGTYIPPQEIIIGQRMGNIRRRDVVVTEQIQCTEQFVPLRYVLQKYFSLEGVMKETLDYIKRHQLLTTRII